MERGGARKRRAIATDSVLETIVGGRTGLRASVWKKKGVKTPFLKSRTAASHDDMLFLARG